MKNGQLTKTGSGQTQVNLKKEWRFSQVAVDAAGETLSLSILDVKGQVILSQEIPLGRGGGQSDASGGGAEVPLGAAGRAAWSAAELEAMECGPWRGGRAVTQLHLKVFCACAALVVAVVLPIYGCCAGCCGCARQLRRLRRLRRRGRTDSGEEMAETEGRSACCGAKF